MLRQVLLSNQAAVVLKGRLTPSLDPNTKLRQRSLQVPDVSVSVARALSDGTSSWPVLAGSGHVLPPLAAVVCDSSEESQRSPRLQTELTTVLKRLCGYHFHVPAVTV